MEGFAMKRCDLRCDQFVRIEMLLPGRPGSVGRNSEKGNGIFVEALNWKFMSATTWRDLLERLGALQSFENIAVLKTGP